MYFGQTGYFGQIGYFGQTLFVLFSLIQSLPQNAKATPNDKYDRASDITHDRAAEEKKYLIALSQQIRELEERVTDVEMFLKDLDREIQEKKDVIEKKSLQVQNVIQTLVRLSQQSPIGALLSQQDPNDAIRTGLISRTLCPEIQQQVLLLKAQLQELRHLHRRNREKYDELTTLSRELSEKRGGLAYLMGSKVRKISETEDSALMSGNLPELFEQIGQNTRKSAPIEAQKRSPSESPHFAEENSSSEDSVATDDLLPPVSGRALRSYHAENSGTPYGQGLVIQTRSQAQVAAPTAGLVVFAGTFRSYGKMIILHTKNNLYVLLSGLGKIFAHVGQDVSAGEPIGLMPSQESLPNLYLELRNESGAIDPAPWIRRWKK